MSDIYTDKESIHDSFLFQINRHHRACQILLGCGEEKLLDFIISLREDEENVT